MYVSTVMVGRTLVWLALQAPVGAPAPATADSSSRAAPADSLAAPAPIPAGLDSLVTAGGDSLAASADSVAAIADSTLVEPEPDAGLVPPPPWSRSAGLLARDFTETDPGLLGEALLELPSTALRVAGDWGAPAYLSIGPVGGPAPEIVYDGVPSRSPADLDPSVWDRSVTGLASLGVAGFDAPAGGPPRLMAETLAPLPGRTHLRTHFARDPYESYLRGLWLTTPGAARVVRLELEEWKAEEGFNSTLDPVFDTLPDDLGRSKMRRFRVGGDAATGLGRVSLSFGRGRRLYRGSVHGPGDVERWTGEIAAGLDRAEGDAYWRLRGYHLDFSDDDRTHAESRDAARVGLSVSRTPLRRGLGWSLQAERWIARFTSGAFERLPAPSYVARTAMSWREPWTPRLVSTAFVEGVYAEHAIDHWDGAGGLQVEAVLSEHATLETGLARRLRIPTLLESDGRITFDVADGGSVTRDGAGPIPPERQDHAHATLHLSGERWSLSGTAETWRLTRGIGWQATSPTTATTVSSLEMSTHQVGGAATLRGGGTMWGWILSGSGRHVLGPLTHARDRGAGWPLWSAQARAHLSRQVASHHNRAFVETSVHATGPRFDDTQAALYATRLPAHTRLDVRGGLKIRDAEIYVAMRNVLDAELIEVWGTRRRGREVRLGLTWPFFN